MQIVRIHKPIEATDWPSSGAAHSEKCVGRRSVHRQSSKAVTDFALRFDCSEIYFFLIDSCHCLTPSIRLAKTGWFTYPNILTTLHVGDIHQSPVVRSPIYVVNRLWPFSWFRKGSKISTKRQNCEANVINKVFESRFSAPTRNYTVLMA